MIDRHEGSEEGEDGGEPGGEFAWPEQSETEMDEEERKRRMGFFTRGENGEYVLDIGQCRDAHTDRFIEPVRLLSGEDAGDDEIEAGKQGDNDAIREQRHGEGIGSLQRKPYPRRQRARRRTENGGGGS